MYINGTSGLDEMTIDVLLWSPEAKEAVVGHLLTSIDQSVTPSDVKMAPLEKMRIAWKSGTTPVSDDFTIRDTWITNADQPNRTTFQFTCHKVAKCEELKQTLSSSPEFLERFELQYVVKGLDPERMVISVLGEHVRAGNHFKEIVKSFPAGQDKICLKSKDVETISMEAVILAVAPKVTNFTFVEEADTVKFSNLLTESLQQRWEQKDEVPPELWDSVYWNQTWARPDKLAKFLNNVLTEDTENTNYFFIGKNDQSPSVSEYNNIMRYMRMLAWSGNTEGDPEPWIKVPKLSVSQYLLDENLEVEWREGAFRAKPDQWYCFNPSQPNATSAIATTNINVKQREMVRSANLRLKTNMSSEECGLKMVTLEFEKKLTAQREEIMGQILQMEDKFNSEREELQSQLRDMEKQVNEILKTMGRKEKKEVKKGIIPGADWLVRRPLFLF